MSNAPIATANTFTAISKAKCPPPNLLTVRVFVWPALDASGGAVKHRTIKTNGAKRRSDRNGPIAARPATQLAHPIKSQIFWRMTFHRFRLNYDRLMRTQKIDLVMCFHSVPAAKS